jgi:hypothetical protein
MVSIILEGNVNRGSFGNRPGKEIAITDQACPSNVGELMTLDSYVKYVFAACYATSTA